MFLTTHFITFALTIFHEYFANALPISNQPKQTCLHPAASETGEVFFWTVTAPNKETRVISRSCRPRDTVPDS